MGKRGKQGAGDFAGGSTVVHGPVPKTSEVTKRIRTRRNRPYKEMMTESRKAYDEASKNPAPIVVGHKLPPKVRVRNERKLARDAALRNGTK
jgi:hypothetical protein